MLLVSAWPWVSGRLHAAKPKQGQTKAATTLAMPEPFRRAEPPVEPAYRLGDLVMGKLYRDHLRHPAVEPNPWVNQCSRFNGSLGCSYVTRVLQLSNGSTSALLQRGVTTFCSVVSQQMRKYPPALERDGSSLYGSSYVAIHMRLGDVLEEPYYWAMGCNMRQLVYRPCHYARALYGHPASFSKLNLYNATSCVLVGDPTYRNSRATNVSLRYVSAVKRILNKRGCKVHKRFGRSADDDLRFMVAAPAYIQSGASSFSHLVQKCRENARVEMGVGGLVALS